jgi:hypothetical protein
MRRFRVEMGPDGELRFYRPDGRPIPEAPKPPVLAQDPLAVLEQRHREEGLEIDAGACFPSWDGGSWDLNWALEALPRHSCSPRRNTDRGSFGLRRYGPAAIEICTLETETRRGCPVPEVALYGLDDSGLQTLGVGGQGGGGHPAQWATTATRDPHLGHLGRVGGRAQ